MANWMPAPCAELVTQSDGAQHEYNSHFPPEAGIVHQRTPPGQVPAGTAAGDKTVVLYV